MDQKSVILSFPLTYINITINNLLISEANYNTQARSFISNTVRQTNVILQLKHNNCSSFIYLVYTKHSIHEFLKLTHNSQIRLSSQDAINRSQSFTHPGHPLRMLLAEASHLFIPIIHLGCHQPKLIIYSLGHPLWMLLVEASHLFFPIIHLGCHQPKLIIYSSWSSTLDANSHS